MFAKLQQIINQTHDEDLFYHLAFLDSIEDAVITTDTEFFITSWNKGAEAIHGIPAKEAIGQKGTELLNYEYVHSDRSTAIRTVNDCGTWRGIVKYTRHDKKNLYLESQVTKVVNQDGNVIGFVGVNRDITDTFKAKAFLNNYISILDAVEETYIVIDAEMKVVFSHFKESVKNFYKFTYEQGEPVLDRIPENRKNAIETSCRMAFSGQTVSYEITSPLSPGVHLYVQYFPLINIPGTVSHICVLIRDISVSKTMQLLRENQRITEERLFQSRQLFEECMERSPSAGWITDPDGNMRYMNSAYLQSVGLTKEHIGRNIREIFPKKIADEYLLNNLKVIETGFPIETVEEGHENTGLISIYKIVRFPILFNETVMVGGWAVNITDQIKIQEQLLQNEKIKARHTLKSVITTAESERNYLSVFLRDNVNQVLSSSKLMLEVSSSYTNKFVISAIGHMQEAIDEINTICDQLNPRIVEELGFKEALTTLSIQAKGMVMFHLNLPENDSLNLDSEVQLGVFRIVQNYLTLVKGQYPIFEATVTVSQSPKKVFITFKRWNSAMLKSVSATYEWTGVINRVSYLGGMISFRQKEIKIAIPRKASN